MKTGVLAFALLLTASPSWAAGDDDENRVTARLEGRQEVPAISTSARGALRATIDKANRTMQFSLTFDGLRGLVRQAHIHTAQRGVNGGIMVWLCGSATNPGPAGTQLCPQSGTVTGALAPSNVLAVTVQGIGVGEFERFVAAIEEGVAYVNVHTDLFPGGEIRGQLKADD